VTVFPEERASATASRLNSSVYRSPGFLLLPTRHYFLWNHNPSLRVSTIKGKITPSRTPLNDHFEINPVDRGSRGLNYPLLDRI
jgi:hypothetical protein